VVWLLGAAPPGDYPPSVKRCPGLRKKTNQGRSNIGQRRKTMPTRLFVFLTFLLTSLACTTSAQMTELAAKNVFQIKAPSGTGSAFTIKVDGREYLITAKHMVKGLKADGSKQSIEVRKLRQGGNRGLSNGPPSLSESSYAMTRLTLRCLLRKP
jgi:hypothetical protein